MSRTPSYIQPQKIGGSELTDSSGNVVVRPVVSLGDASSEANLAIVTPDGALTVDGSAVIQPVAIKPQAAVLTSSAVNFSAAGNTSLVVAPSGLTTKTHKLLLVVGGATTLTIQDGSTALTGPIPLGAGGSIVLDYSSEPWFSTSSFTLNSTNAVQVSGQIGYINS